MKPERWDEFLEDIANEYRLRGQPRNVFLVRFAYENCCKRDEELWEQAEAPNFDPYKSFDTYKRQRTDVYNRFSQDLQFDGPGPGKFKKLLDWLSKKHPEWLKRQTPTVPNGISYKDCITPPPLPTDCSFYVERPQVEAKCYAGILYPGSLIRIRAAEKMGKTSLLRRILAKAGANGDRTVCLDLREAELSIFGSLDRFLRWFAANVSEELGTRNKAG